MFGFFQDVAIFCALRSNKIGCIQEKVKGSVAAISTYQQLVFRIDGAD
jgi:hypothetical protein